MKAQTITTVQRFADRAGTIPVDGTFNVYIDRKYIGIVYAKGNRWQWGGQFHQDAATFAKAVAMKVRDYHRTNTIIDTIITREEAQQAPLF